MFLQIVIEQEREFASSDNYELVIVARLAIIITN